MDQIGVVGLKAWISKDILSSFLFVFLEDLFSFAFSLFLKYRNGFGFLPFNDWGLEVYGLKFGVDVAFFEDLIASGLFFELFDLEGE